MVVRGRPEPEPTILAQQQRANRKRVERIDVLRSELNAAKQLTEHRERWWATGLRNAESAVGLEMERARASEVATAESMEAQVAFQLGVLRTTQNRAESSSMAALEQQRMASDFDACAKRVTAQRRMMITKSEQKQ